MLHRHSNTQHNKFNFIREYDFDSKHSFSEFSNTVGVDEKGNKIFITYFNNPQTTEAVYFTHTKFKKLISDRINTPNVFDYDSNLSCIYSQFVEGIILADFITAIDSKARYNCISKVLNEIRRISSIEFTQFQNFDIFNLELILQFNGIKSNSLFEFFKNLSFRLKEFPQSVLHTDFNTTNIIVSHSEQKLFFVDYLNMALGPRLIDRCSFIIDPQAQFNKEETNFIIKNIFSDPTITSEELQSTLLYESIRKLLILRLIGKSKHNNEFIVKSNYIAERMKIGFYNFEELSATSFLNDFFYELDKAN